MKDRKYRNAKTATAAPIEWKCSQPPPPPSRQTLRLHKQLFSSDRSSRQQHAMKSGRHSYSKLPLPSTDDSLSIPIPNLADSPSRISSDVRSIYSSTTSLASTSAFIAKKPIALTLHSTSYSVKDGKRQDKQILSNVSCFVKPGQLLAVLGSSGAGKSTLLDILADRRKSGRLENKLWVNGED